MKKYELTSETKEVFGRNLYRIRALVDFGDVKAGELAKARIDVSKVVTGA